MQNPPKCPYPPHPQDCSVPGYKQNQCQCPQYHPDRPRPIILHRSCLRHTKSHPHKQQHVLQPPPGEAPIHQGTPSEVQCHQECPDCPELPPQGRGCGPQWPGFQEEVTGNTLTILGNLANFFHSLRSQHDIVDFSPPLLIFSQ